MNFTKAFDTNNYELLIAKVHTYGFNNDILNLFYSYLSNRWHRDKN